MKNSGEREPFLCAHDEIRIYGQDRVPWQQDELFKSLYMNIIDNDLKHAYSVEHPEKKHGTVDTSPRKIIIVGAGISGLTAAYELEKVGYETLILEMQDRVGGRVKTIREGFAEGLKAEAGAMRIPVKHFLTHAYINKFDIQLREFVPYNERAYIYIDEHKPIRVKDWNENNVFYSNYFFPGWDANIREDLRPQVQGINDYYHRTIQFLKDELQRLGWKKWIEKWDKYTIHSFLRESPDEHSLKSYRPWPEIAIKGFEFSFNYQWCEDSLVDIMKEEFEGWLSGHLDYPVQGMAAIPEAFVHADNDKLLRRIKFGIKVDSVKKHNKGVCVTGRNTTTGLEMRFEGDAAILTTPLSILKQMDIDLDSEKCKAIATTSSDPTTKVFLQCSRRFWEDDVGYGGVTLTNLPIQQIRYPNKNDPPPPNPRGILVCHIEGNQGLMFRSQSDKEALGNVVKQVSKIHPEIVKYYEVGKLQKWLNDPSAQGAYTDILPGQHIGVVKTLMRPCHPIYIAGDAVSHCNAWIQGAVESGLRCAFQLYSYDQVKPRAKL